MALLRAVNVGGNNKIAMKSLAEIFSGASCRNVETYIQSGNVLFSADAKTAAKAAGEICGQIEKQFGFKTHILLRSLEEIKRIEAGNPYADVEKLHVVFLAQKPSLESVASLDPKRSPPDTFTVSGSEIYVRFANGAGTTKLTNAYFDSKLKTISTMRNWRTVQKLSAMMSG